MIEKKGIDNEGYEANELPEKLVTDLDEANEIPEKEDRDKTKTTELRQKTNLNMYESKELAEKTDIDVNMVAVNGINKPIHEEPVSGSNEKLDEKNGKEEEKKQEMVGMLEVVSGFEKH